MTDINQNFFKRILCFGLSLTLLWSEVFAVVKEVNVGGAYSANDLGQSDNRVTMSEVKSDYSDYKQTDWLTEYFHKDSEDPAKIDQGEALSWLIDHEIINRDLSVEISNVYPANTQLSNATPNITIRKLDLNNYMSTPVNRSDMIMYLYKAVFGPIDARTVGIEIPNVRVDNGSKKSLWTIMDSHDYWKTIAAGNTCSIIQEESTGGDQSVTASHISDGIMDIDNQSVNSQGGIAGQQQLGASEINTSTKWRYTPQGDEYESIFGDTNIFVSDIDIAQQGNTGEAIQGQGISSNGGTTEVDPTREGDNFSNNTGSGNIGPTQEGNHNAQQSEWAGTGGLNQAVAVESDYKQVYYTPGADLLFYRTNDCVELYIQNAISKGLLNEDRVLRPDKYNEVFIKSYESQTSKLHPWSPSAPAFIVNRSKSILNTDSSNVRLPTDTIYLKAKFSTSAYRNTNVLGENFNVIYTPGTPAKLTIQRNNLFASNTGYFDSERISRMQFYKYIYTFLSGKEKKLSNLETDIINYKYGMQLDTLGSEDDVAILKYLIAMGIINYDSTYDLQNLNTAICYDDFLNILYRVANPNARLDFSKVQLTDSESQWQAMGFNSRKVVMTPLETVSFVDVSDPNPNTEDTEEEPLALVMYSGSGEIVDESIGSASDVLNALIQQSESDSIVVSPFRAGVSNNSLQVKSTEGAIGTLSVHGINMSFHGAYVDPNNVGVTLGDNVRMYDISKFNVVNQSSTRSQDNNFYAILDYYIAEIISNEKFLKSWQKKIGSQGSQDNSGGIYFKEAALEIVADEQSGNGLESLEWLSKFDDVPYLDLYNYLCTNVYVIALLKSGRLNLNNVIAYLDEAKLENPTGFFKTLLSYVTGDANKIKATNNLISHVQQTFQAYVTGANSPDSIVFTLGADTNPLGGGSIGSKTNLKSAVDMSSGDMYWALLNAIGNLESIELKYNVNGDGSEEVWTLNREVPFYRMETIYNNVDVPKSAGVAWDYGDSLKFSVSMVTNSEKSKSEALAAASRGIQRFDYDVSNSLNLSLNVQAPSSSSKYGGFVSWAEISKNAGLLGIERVSDSILHNINTDTYAYFPVEGSSYKYALVGTSLVEGDPDQGTAKTMNGQVWYWYDAIRLLIGTQGESAVLNGVEGITLPAKSVTYHSQNIPVQSEGGYTGNSLNAIRVRLGKESDLSSYSGEAGKFIKSQPSFDGWYWANYVAASTSNRALNIVSKKITYTPDSSNNQKINAFAIVSLRPTEVSGSAGVTKGMSLQDTLDSIAKEPSDAGARAKWLQNKQLCNDYLNWIYCTENQEYISTGYLVPEVFIYYDSTTDSSAIPMSEFGTNITDLMKANPVSFHGFIPIKDGMVDDCGDRSVTPADSTKNLDKMYRASYYLGDDYRVAVIGDRIYVHENYVPSLSGFMGFDPSNNNQYKYCYKLVNRSITQTDFYVGRSFNLAGFTDTYLFDTVYTPKVTVMSMSSDGTVTCQLGPLMGLPTTVGTTKAIINYDTVLSQAEEFPNGANTPLNVVASSLKGNLWSYAQSNMLASYSDIEWTDRIVDLPHLATNPSGKRYGVYNGQSISVYNGSNSLNSSKRWNCGAIYTTGSDTVQSLYENKLVKGLVNPTYNFPSGHYLKYIETYAEIKFSAYDYTIYNDQLISSQLSISDLFSPSLFSSTNDMIIEQMMMESLAAIPLNQVPEGSLVEVGDGWYIAANADETNKKFVGYSLLDGYARRMVSPTIQDASYSMANHFIRGGNQYVNIVHYITDFTVLNDTESGESSYWTWKGTLEKLASIKMKDTTSTSIRLACLGGSDKIIGISTGVTTGTTGNISYHYAPLMLQFSDVLMAYPITPEGSEVPIYKICNFASNSMAGALSDLPFFSDDVVNAKLNDQTTVVISGGYAPYEESKNLMSAIRDEFSEAFAGDLFTLVRLILFILLIWMFLISWVCYGFYWSRLMPMVDAICHPSNDRAGRGIDLFKIFSLGTISVDSDFKLGRFLQYDLIIAILILVVWKSGNIGF